MNESVAHAVLLARAVETTAGPPVFSDDDRRHAGRAALELARWQAAERKVELAPAAFLAKRSELLLERLRERQPAALRSARALRWPRWLGVVLPLAALLLGLVSVHIVDRQRVNLLAFPLLALMVWNVVVYIGLLLHAAGVGRQALPRVSRWLAGNAARRGGQAPWLLAFAGDWTRLSAALYRARSARILHLAAALFGVGAVAALYLQGIVFEYRVGWESTFLDAGHVQRWLGLLLGPASALTGLALPTLQEIEALRFDAGEPGGAAARWIHLYAVTVAVVVVLPRLLLATAARLRERHLRRHLPVDLEEPYFRRLLDGLGAPPAQVRVLPYSYTPDEGVTDGLRRLVQQLFGESAQITVRPVLAYGDEERAADGLRQDGEQRVLTLVLVSLATTPEHEGHGALLAALKARLPRAPALLVDESAYRRRLGTGAEARLAERRDAWRAFGQAHGVAVAILDLAAPDVSQQAQAESAFALKPAAT